MLHDILDDDHIQRHPPLIGHYTNFWPLLIWTLLPNLTFYLIVQGFHRTYATGVACQQRTLTPLDTWSCPTLGLACVLMSRPISPELVLSRNFWIPNIPRYFSFAWYTRIRMEGFRNLIHFKFFSRTCLHFSGLCYSMLIYEFFISELIYKTFIKEFLTSEKSFNMHWSYIYTLS